MAFIIFKDCYLLFPDAIYVLSDVDCKAQIEIGILVGIFGEDHRSRSWSSEKP